MLYIAHRGSCLKHPENSLAALKQAMNEDFHGIEFDIRCSKDKKLYLLHDSRLFRTTNYLSKLSSKTSNELTGCRLKNGEPIPTLTDALCIIRNCNLIFIEIKGL